jgi:predicted RNase H-like nuclease
MVSSAIWEKHARVSVFQRRPKLHKSEGRVQFEVFEKLTSVAMFFQIARETMFTITY